MRNFATVAQSLFRESGEIAKSPPSSAARSPGVDGLFAHITRRQTYLAVIWCWQTPRCRPRKKKTKQISRRRTFHRRRQTAKNLFRWERLKGDGYELLLLHVKEWMMAEEEEEGGEEVFIGSVAAREKEEAERRMRAWVFSLPLLLPLLFLFSISLPFSSPAVSQSLKPLSSFFRSFPFLPH